MIEQFLLFLISLLANTLSAFSGGGAGLVQLPALIFLGLPFPIALSTHKIATVALGLGAFARHYKEKNIDFKVSFIMLLFGVPGVILGANLILEVPEEIAKKILGILILGLGTFSYFRKDMGTEYIPQVQTTFHLIIGGFGYFLIGIMNGSLSSGSGLFVTLWSIYWLGLDYKRAVAYTLTWVGLFWNGTGAITLGILADVQWSWLPVLILGSLLGGYIGASLSILKGNKVIKRVFEILTFIIGVKLIYN